MSTHRRRDANDRTGGHCHLCGKKLAYNNYGKPGARGAWHIDHSQARGRGALSFSGTTVRLQ